MIHIADSPIPALTAESWSFAEVYPPIVNDPQQARVETVQAGLTPISQGVASALTVLAKAVNTRIMVEIDTALGTSALPLLAGIAFDGVLTGVDSEVGNQLPARSFLNAAGYPSPRCRLIAGAPLEILPKLRDGAYNTVFINGDELEYAEYVAVALRLLRPGDLLIIHDVLWYNAAAGSGRKGDETIIICEALDAVRAADSCTTTLLTVDNGLLVAVKD